ncbi:hypothetical protein EVAR_82478_1 [Eumeta japonica]|uniref:Uncharacterized protein n=1 Tax=Eumeta variegata TaxID=151549 RepID=A0A4C1X459_EUMVA|nr:hypothetical protein EVAR_82478_1 [Eumeta japonica]
MDDAWRKSSRHRMSQETVTGGSVSTFRGLRIRWWDVAVDSQPRAASALGYDPAMSKNRFDASFIFGNGGEI